MSQSRARKSQTFGGETGTRARTSVVKASGDSAPSAPRQNQQKRKNSNKIPKSVRYELDSALVALCDVWFEDIKPHLVRNKMKLHVETDGVAASGDYSGPHAPACSHLDPGAASDVRATAGLPWRFFRSRIDKNNARGGSRNLPVDAPLQRTTVSSAACYRARQTASRAPCCRQPASAPRPPSRPAQSTPPLNEWTSQLNSLVPPRNTTKPQPTQNSITQTYITKVRNQSITQITPVACKVPVLKICKKRNLMSSDAAYSKNSVKLLQRRHGTNMSHPISLLSSVKQGPGSTYKRNVQSATDNDKGASNYLQNQTAQTRVKQESVPISKPGTERRRSREKKTTTISAPRDKLPEGSGNTVKKEDSNALCSPCSFDKKLFQFNRCFATTNLNPAKSKKDNLKSRKQLEIDSGVIFEDKLIDIIASKNDKRLKLLYQSPIREDLPSIMNLLPSPHDQKIEASCKKTSKTQPWR